MVQEVKSGREIKAELINFFKTFPEYKRERAKIVRFFEKKNNSFFKNQNKIKIEAIKILFSLNPELLLKLLVENEKILEYYEIKDTSLSEEEIQKIIIKPLIEEVLNNSTILLPSRIDILQVAKTIVKINNRFYDINGKVVNFVDNFEDLIIATLNLKPMR